MIDRWDNQGFADKSAWLKAGECGLLGINIPAEYGGVGGSFLDATIVMEELYAFLILQKHVYTFTVYI